MTPNEDGGASPKVMTLDDVFEEAEIADNVRENPEFWQLTDPENFPWLVYSGEYPGMGRPVLFPCLHGVEFRPTDPLPDSLPATLISIREYPYFGPGGSGLLQLGQCPDCGRIHYWQKQGHS